MPSLIHKAVTAKPRVLIVEDWRSVRSYLARAFTGFECFFAQDTRHATLLTQHEQRVFSPQRPFDLVSCDIHMPFEKRYGPFGILFMRQFHTHFPNVPIICHSDDLSRSRYVSFARFVEKMYVDRSLRLLNEDMNILMMRRELVELGFIPPPDFALLSSPRTHISPVSVG